MPGNADTGSGADKGQGQGMCQPFGRAREPDVDSVLHLR
jgi:hypothetical protein